jgi:hypothetical protein
MTPSLPKPFAAYRDDEPFVFVCYSSSDKDTVYPDIAHLHDKGVRIWYHESSDPDPESTEVVSARIRACSFFIVFLTSNAIRSEYLHTEIAWALGAKKQVLPVYLEPLESAGDLENFLRLARLLDPTASLWRGELSRDEYLAQLKRPIPRQCFSHPEGTVDEAEVVQEAIAEFHSTMRAIEEFGSVMRAGPGGIAAAFQLDELLGRLTKLRNEISRKLRFIGDEHAKAELLRLKEEVDRNLATYGRALRSSAPPEPTQVREFNELAQEFQHLVESVQRNRITSRSMLDDFRKEMRGLELRAARLQGEIRDNQGKEAVTQLVGAIDSVLKQLPAEEAQTAEKAAAAIQGMTSHAGLAAQHETRGEGRRFRRLRFLLGKLKRSVRDPVDCTVFSPPEARAGGSILVQVFAHIPERAKEARELAEEFDATATRLGVTPLTTEIGRGSRLTFELIIPGLMVHDSVKELTWRGRTQSVGFAVGVPSNCRPQNVIGKVLVSQDTVPIGEVTFNLKVVPDSAVADTESGPVGTGKRYRMAFISYSSKDRAEVLKRVQMLTAVGIRYFQDVLDLDPGDRWERELYRHIDESDVMFLFWSTEARESEWVRREWQYGLERRGEDFIRPVIIEGPPHPEPPPELAHLHFSDKVLYVLAST